MENTIDIATLVKGLDENQVQTLILTLQEQNKVFIPQWYFEEHSKYYGYKNLKEMRRILSHLYEDIDDIVKETLVFSNFLSTFVEQ